MTNKVTKYGLMTIAAVLLVAMAFAGAASAVSITADEWNSMTTSDQINGNETYVFTGSGIIYPKYNGSSTTIYSTDDTKYVPNRSITFDFTNYQGTFAGVNSASTDNQGALFGYIENTSGPVTITIKNLALDRVNVKLAIMVGNVAGIVGNFNGNSTDESNIKFINCTLMNCSIGLRKDYGSTGGHTEGGLVGKVDSASVYAEDCKIVHCEIVGNYYYIGGLVGKATYARLVGCNVTNSTFVSTTYNQVGGLVGESTSLVSIENCGVENTSLSGKQNVGGLFGQSNNVDKIVNCIVKNCVIVNNKTAAGNAWGVGGLFSAVWTSCHDIIGCHVVNCTIKAQSGAAGLAVYLPTEIDNCSGNSVENCAVTSESGATLVGPTGKDLGCTANLDENFIYNDTIKDIIAFSCAVNMGDFWHSISYTNATNATRNPPGTKDPLTYLGTYGEVGGYGVIPLCTVSYNANGAIGDVPASQTCAAGSTVTVAEKGNLAMSGYAFAGWYNESTGLLDEGDQVTIHGDVTLYANWSAIEYNITYNNMTGATNPGANPATYYITSSVITLENAYKQGYVFEDWYNLTVFGDASRNNTIPAGSTGNKVFYANWTANTTDVKATGNKAVFGNDNVTAIHSTSGDVVKVLLEEVSNVTNTAVNFTADNTTVPFNFDGYNKDEIAVFEINASAVGTAKINLTVTFKDVDTANTKKDNVSFYHYNTTNSAWDTTPLTFTMVQNGAEVLYTVETTSFSPFGIGIFTPITYTVHFNANGGQGSMADMTFTYDQGQNLTANVFQRYNSNFLYWTCNGNKYYNNAFVQNLTTVNGTTVEMKAQWETYSTGGSSSGTTYMGSNSASYTPTQQPTVKPTVAPTVAPTEQPATPTVIATEKPTTQATQSSPAPFVGLLAGLGAAAVLLRLRK